MLQCIIICVGAAPFLQIVEQAEGELLHVAIWRAKAYYNYGVALDPEATRRVLEASDEGNATDPKKIESVQAHIKHMLGHGYNPIVKGFKSASERLRVTKQVSSSLAALRKQVEQEAREVSELARKVRDKGKHLSIATSLGSRSRGGDEAASPPTPEVLRRVTEHREKSLASPDGGGGSATLDAIVDDE